MSKTANLDTTSIQIFYIHMYCLCRWLVATLKGGGRVRPLPPLNETLLYKHREMSQQRCKPLQKYVCGFPVQHNEKTLGGHVNQQSTKSKI